MIGRYVIAYIDEILVYSSSFDEHVKHIWKVLACLLQHCLFVKVEKYEFHQDTITFLRYVILQKGVEMDEGKVRAVTKWPEPTTVKELQCFLGFANFYRRFIRNYSSISSPLTSLLRSQPKCQMPKWNEEAWRDFVQLKVKDKPSASHRPLSRTWWIRKVTTRCWWRLIDSPKLAIWCH
ncbi:hypothetical protein QTP70_007643 [Hemibagrus guttatus]|uniref:Reverse transcriptase domain-containing protein n=1 Tax=Hemibagrus guttatus TaxID=175788 RepID=A0AAE0VAN7_9TELE|nr:hypothetical protein QTP70_007643 [Hemibagrus guttatus]